MLVGRITIPDVSTLLISSSILLPPLLLHIVFPLNRTTNTLGIVWARLNLTKNRTVKGPRALTLYLRSSIKNSVLSEELISPNQF